MLYLLHGNAEQIFQVFGQRWAIDEGRDEAKTIELDLPRTDFLGTQKQALKHFNLWRNKALGHYYLQGNMSAGCLSCLLGVTPLMKKDEPPEEYHSNFMRHHFAYISDAGEACGLMVMYRKDDPKQWAMGLLKKGYAAPEKREIVFVSSVDLDPYIKSSYPGLRVSTMALSGNPLAREMDSSLVSVLLKDAVRADSGELNVRFSRIKLLLRHLQVHENTVMIQKPISFSDLNLAALFADNPSLDLIVKYNSTNEFRLSFASLKDLLSESSSLRKEIEAIKLTEDETLNKNLLKMTIIFFENGMLEKNRHLLNDHVLIKTFSGLMWDEQQIKLLPFLIQKKYDHDLIKLILSKTAYYNAIYRLIELEPALTQEVPTFFKDSKKQEELKWIYNLADEESKILCLLFWVKGSLSSEGYQELTTATKKYPLLASTLVALDQTKTIDIDHLRKLALNPQQHLQKSILHHFSKELELFHDVHSHVYHLKQHELEAASAALIQLKHSGAALPRDYHSVLKKDKKGHALRLFLPQMAHFAPKYRKSLIDILYAGVNKGIHTLGNKVLEIKNQEHFALAKSLQERFICVSQLQDLNFGSTIVEFVAREDTEAAKRFRQVILRVEAKCKLIYERLSGSASSRKMLEKWSQEEEQYRKALYQIVYAELIEPQGAFRDKLQRTSENILNIVDPKLTSGLYQFLIVITNIIISILTVGLANVIKYSNTGNCWFFNQSQLGEEVRALETEVIGLTRSEPDNDIETQSLVLSPWPC